MKRINLLLSVLIVIMVILVIGKILKQEVIIEKDLSQIEENEEQIKYEAYRELAFGEKGIYSKFDEDGKRVNTSEENKKEREIEPDVKIKEVNLEYKDGYTYIRANVKNESNENKGGYPVKLYLINDNQEEINSFNSYLNKVEPGAETTVTTCIPGDIADSFKIEVRKVGGTINENEK